MTNEFDRLERYLAEAVPSMKGPMTFEKFSGGQSNPTYLIRAANGCYVLRRQPSGELLPSAHAVDREYRVLAALAGTDVPVARAIHLCEDRSVIGSMFYVMSFEAGRIFWRAALPEAAPSERESLYLASIDAMARLHNVEPQCVGLGDYGRPGNYFERQIRLWTKQYRASETERVEAIEELIAWLPQHCPEDDGQLRLVHGDFRLDNLIFHPDQPRVKAILDWELSTLGNPLADLAYFCMCLRMPVDAYIPGLAGCDRQALGIPDEAALIARYSAQRRIPEIADWPFYIAFSFFRLAAIAQGVKRRAINGNASSAEAQQVGEMVEPLARMAVATIHEVFS